MFFAKFHFEATKMVSVVPRSAMELPQQVHSQVQLGNEGCDKIHEVCSVLVPLEEICPGTFQCGALSCIQAANTMF